MKDDFIIFAGLGVAALIGIAWLANRAKAGVVAVAGKLDPTSTSNVVYDNVVNKVGSVLTGDKAFNLGGWFYDKFHQDPLMQSTLPKAGPAPKPGEAGLPVLNKANTAAPGSGYEYLPGGSFEGAKGATPAPAPAVPYWPFYK